MSTHNKILACKFLYCKFYPVTLIMPKNRGSLSELMGKTSSL